MQFPAAITSRDNTLVKQLHKLAHDGAAYRKLEKIWLEGEHLVSSFLQKQQAENALETGAAQAALAALKPEKLLISESYISRLPSFLATHGLTTLPCPVLVLADSLLPAITRSHWPAAGHAANASPPLASRPHRGVRPAARRRQCRRHLALRFRFWLSANHRHQRHGRLVVAQGAARRYGGAFQLTTA